jgi:hypothetical protein
METQTINQTEEQKESTKLTRLEEAQRLVERMEKANEETKLLLEKAEQMRINDLLSGEAKAGQPEAPKETTDEKWEREARERYKGTGMDPTPSRKK